MPDYARANGLLTGKSRVDRPLPQTTRAEEIPGLYLENRRSWLIVEL